MPPLTQTQQLEKENKLLRQLGTRTGFFQYYFEQLPNHRNQIECFNAANDMHLMLYGEEKYQSYDSFRKSLAHYNRNQK